MFLALMGEMSVEVLTIPQIGEKLIVMIHDIAFGGEGSGSIRRIRDICALRRAGRGGRRRK
jgi:hypothetical protein